MRPQDRPLWTRKAETSEGYAVLHAAKMLAFKHPEMSDGELIRLAYWGASGKIEFPHVMITLADKLKYASYTPNCLFAILLIRKIHTQRLLVMLDTKTPEFKAFKERVDFDDDHWIVTKIAEELYRERKAMDADSFFNIMRG